MKDLGFAWQRNFFEHRVRPRESLESFALYCVLNPYRAQLVRYDQKWEFWDRTGYPEFHFEKAMGEKGIPLQEWEGRVKDLDYLE